MPGQQPATLPAILIPGFSGEACLAIAAELTSKGFTVIAGCEDGNAADVARQAGCIIVEAPKAQALRDGLEYFRREMQGLPGVVIADTQDSYSTVEILAVAYVCAANPERIVLGVRTARKQKKKRLSGVSDDTRRLMDSKDLKGSFDRKAAGAAFAVVHGRMVKDAWSGLVALPAAKMAALLEEKGNGGRLLFNILLSMQRHGLRAVNVPIGLPYRRREGETGKSRLFDIGNIVWLPVKFISASLTATLCDYCIRFLSFGLVFAGTADPKTWSLIAGRATGGVVGYFLNRSLVFRKKNDTLKKELWTMAQYMALVIINFGLSWLLVTFFMWIVGSFYIASPMADAVLYLANYTIQRDIIFRRKAQPAN